MNIIYTFIFAFIINGITVDDTRSLASESSDLGIEINMVHPPFSISKSKLMEAVSIKDLNRVYRRTWIKDFISVEMTSICNGQKCKAISYDDLITEEQRKLFQRADAGEKISIRINYIPENTLSHNDPKQYTFNVNVNPDTEASFYGGQDKMNEYLKNKLGDHIPKSVFTGYKLAAVTFTVDEEGQIMSPKVFWSSEDEKVDKMMFEAVCNMPKWLPAKYSDGTKTPQKFALTIGNMENCVVNTLNIHPR